MTSHFNNQLDLTKTLVERRLRALLERNRDGIRERLAFRQAGLGLRQEEFDEIIQKLFAEGFLTVDLTLQGKRVLILRELNQ
jgi:hypothetical protein